MFNLKRSRFALVLGLFLGLALGLALAPLAAAPEAGAGLKASNGGLELAQAPSDRQQRAEARFDSLCVFLKLSDKQKKDARALFDAMQAQMSKLREEIQSGSKDRESSRDEMRSINQNYLDKLEALLKADQKELLKQWNEAHPRRGGPPRG